MLMTTIKRIWGTILLWGGINLMTLNCGAIEVLSAATIAKMKATNVWNESCPVGLERLRTVTFRYVDFEGQTHSNGRIVILDVVAEHTAHIFQALYERQFPIAQAQPIETYQGNDELSMAANNTACFNCRQITGGGAPSIHSYGLAIDINPLQNPFISPKKSQETTQAHIVVMPAAGINYLNRTHTRPGMVENEGIREIFYHYGFKVWGGSWNDPIDWHHFQPSRAMAQLLAAMTSEDGSILFKLYCRESTLLNAVDAKQNQLVSLYQHNPQQFMQILQENPTILTLSPAEAYKRFEQAIQ